MAISRLVKALGVQLGPGQSYISLQAGYCLPLRCIAAAFKIFPVMVYDCTGAHDEVLGESKVVIVGVKPSQLLTSRYPLY